MGKLLKSTFPIARASENRTGNLQHSPGISGAEPVKGLAGLSLKDRAGVRQSPRQSSFQDDVVAVIRLSC
jgi:hypothetical protein